MFNKIFKKKTPLIILHQHDGITGNDARQSSDDMSLSTGCDVVLVPYGYRLYKTRGKWIFEANGKVRHSISEDYITELKRKLGEDVIVVRHGLSISIYEEE